MSAQMVEPLLSMLKTTITYHAPIRKSGVGNCADIAEPQGSVNIDVGTMLNLEDANASERAYGKKEQA